MLNLKEALELHGNYIFGAVLILVFLILGIFALAGGDEVPKTLVLECGDGTPYDSCSIDKPYFCDEGVLVENATRCGCPSSENFDFFKQGDFCVSLEHQNPRDINLTYVLEGKMKSTIFTVFSGIDDYVGNLPRGIDSSQENISRLDFKYQGLDDSLQRETVLPLVKKIQNLAPKSKVDQARIAISMVQNIPYGHSNQIFSIRNQKIAYSRYPYEVLFDEEGICGEKSLLLALILKELDYETSIFYYSDENHEAVGVGCPSKHSLNGTGFCFVETSGPAIISDSGISYVGGVKLNSNPELLTLSDGIILPKGLEEYGDADDLEDIRDRNFLGFLKQWKKDNLEREYMLAEEYRLE